MPCSRFDRLQRIDTTDPEALYVSLPWLSSKSGLSELLGCPLGNTKDKCTTDQQCSLLGINSCLCLSSLMPPWRSYEFLSPVRHRLHCFLQSSLTSGFFCSLPQKCHLSVGVNVCDIDVPFMHLYSLDFDMLSVCVTTTISCTKKVLCWCLNNSLICRYRGMYLEGRMRLCTLINNWSKFSPRHCEFPSDVAWPNLLWSSRKPESGRYHIASIPLLYPWTYSTRLVPIIVYSIQRLVELLMTFFY